MASRRCRAAEKRPAGAAAGPVAEPRAASRAAAAAVPGASTAAASRTLRQGERAGRRDYAGQILQGRGERLRRNRHLDRIGLHLGRLRRLNWSGRRRRHRDLLASAKVGRLRREGHVVAAAATAAARAGFDEPHDVLVQDVVRRNGRRLCGIRRARRTGRERKANPAAARTDQAARCWPDVGRARVIRVAPLQPDGTPGDVDRPWRKREKTSTGRYTRHS